MSTRDASEGPLPANAASSPPAGDPIEAALARALSAAVDAGEWAVVSQLAAELQARRTDAASVASIAKRGSK